ncbi:MAG: hypothetical protein BYD32DRAFT_431301 [Podila humilis]|nr:MAG: hypothetical protein BYD32DRAFT_431301 [Podila humilis]
MVPQMHLCSNACILFANPLGGEIQDISVVKNMICAMFRSVSCVCLQSFFLLCSSIGAWICVRQ